ncbi:hypothetical protein R3P38DRAFT_2779458 [Favolaschia claudopus]|uniref:Secreted protein n=1 Tax=Favolaschia claudopus TaxID=2862362 RepID=A0AAW0BCX1_9AGAR
MVKALLSCGLVDMVLRAHLVCAHCKVNSSTASEVLSSGGQSQGRYNQREQQKQEDGDRPADSGQEMRQKQQSQTCIWWPRVLPCLEHKKFNIPRISCVLGNLRDSSGSCQIFSYKRAVLNCEVESRDHLIAIGRVGIRPFPINPRHRGVAGTEKSVISRAIRCPETASGGRGFYLVWNTKSSIFPEFRVSWEISETLQALAKFSPTSAPSLTVRLSHVTT